MKQKQKNNTWNILKAASVLILCNYTQAFTGWVWTCSILPSSSCCSHAHVTAHTHRRLTCTHLFEYDNNTNDIPWVPQSIKEGLKKESGREKEWESKSLCEQYALISVGRNAICESVRCLNRDSNWRVRTHTLSEKLTHVHTDWVCAPTRRQRLGEWRRKEDLSDTGRLSHCF